jgi:peptidoglycan/xylan/chitin deacetylase (PgdA/CDA1 family)
VEAGSSDEQRARREALSRTHTRRRLTALGVLVLIAMAVVLVLGRSGSAGSPPPLRGVPAPTSTTGQQTPESARAAKRARDDAAIDNVLTYTSYIARGSRRKKEVALTFDDGPGPTTPALLKYLLASKVPATFFLVGTAIAQHTDTVRKQSQGGFSLGTHTQNHARLGSKTVADQSQEILSAADQITQISGHSVKLFRPPYGSFDANTLGVLKDERMIMVLWSIDTKDYEARTPAPVVYTALSGARAGSVVLFHDGPGPRPNTLAAIRKIVPALRRKGYRLVSVPELLRDDPPPRHQPEPHSLAG